MYELNEPPMIPPSTRTTTSTNNGMNHFLLRYRRKCSLSMRTLLLRELVFDQDRGSSPPSDAERAASRSGSLVVIRSMR